MDIVFCSDFFLDDFIGGAALNDSELIKSLSLNNSVLSIKSKNVTLEMCQDSKNKIWILSNFFHLSKECLDYIVENVRYSIMSHDYKFVEHTNPAKYNQFIVPDEDKINIQVFQRARNVFCQSKLQAHIHAINLGIPTIKNLSGNLWSNETFEFCSALSKRAKKQSFAVVKSRFPQKGVPQAINFLIQKGIDYEVVGNPNYFAFLNKMAENRGLAFFPTTPETFSRVVCEAKMCGMEVITNDLVGVAHEEWYQSKDFVQILRAKQTEIPKFIESVI